MKEEDYRIMWVALNKPTLDKGFLLTNNTTLLNALKISPTQRLNYTNLTHFYCAQYLAQKLEDFSVTDPDITWKNVLRNFRRVILPQVEERIKSLSTEEQDIFKQIEQDFKEAQQTTSLNFDAAYQSYLSQHPELQKQDAPDISPEEKKKAELVSQLTSYITRTKAVSNEIKRNPIPESDLSKIIDYGKGFNFFKKRQAANRDLNLLLAEKLLQDLTTPDSTVEQVFQDVNEKRNTIMKERELLSKIYIDTGIKSIDLNNIIKEADEFVAQCSATNSLKQ